MAWRLTDAQRREISRKGSAARWRGHVKGPRVSMKTVKAGEPLPDGEPTHRAVHTNGYVVLFWRINEKLWLRMYEHRYLTGNQPGEVHHRNGVLTDNRPENLEVVSRQEHKRAHASWDISAYARRYEAGASYPEIAREIGIHPVTVMRALKSYGVKSRPIGRPHAQPRA